LVAHVKEIREAEGVQEYGAEEALRVRTEEIREKITK
jgi:hypothetical protein